LGKNSHGAIVAREAGADKANVSPQNAGFCNCFSAARSRILNKMSPTVFRERGYRFYFFSREEERIHVHVHCADGEAKFWLEPRVELATSFGLSPVQLTKIGRIIEAHETELRDAWRTFFGR
jgi:hypothetical protein